MKNLTLKQFQEMTSLPDAAIGWLLKNNRIRCTVDAQRGVLVVADEVNAQALVDAFGAIPEELLSVEYEVIVDRIMHKLDERFELMVDEAVARLAAARATEPAVKS